MNTGVSAQRQPNSRTYGYRHFTINLPKLETEFMPLTFSLDTVAALMMQNHHSELRNAEIK